MHVVGLDGSQGREPERSVSPVLAQERSSEFSSLLDNEISQKT